MIFYANVTIRLPMDVMEKISNDVTTGQHKNKSTAALEYIKVGIRISEYQELLKDPSKSKEFQKKMHDIVQNEKLEGWIESLSSQQLEGLLGLMQIEKEKRYDQRSLI
ncbi:MAG: hypothetical protein OXC46_00880 [Thaumarchaeota archaeon]|nr:hypothetical protein [Nitrososphaerota archaeon]